MLQTTQERLEMYKAMCLIREFEDTCGENYAKGNIRGFLHLYSGQEATGVGVIYALEEKDYIVTHYRDHGHAIARGLDINRCMAELFGKKTGLCKGKGGSMHLFDVAKNFLGGHAIVGAQFPLAIGVAQAIKYKEEDAVVICFLGDGSVNQGTFHESLNIASLWKLPVLFVLENNGYGMGTDVAKASAAGENIYDKLHYYSINGESVDGMDLIAVHTKTHKLVNKIRSKAGPQFLECKTYRFRGHSYADGQKYRAKEEVKEWQQTSDPIKLFEDVLTISEDVNESELIKIRQFVKEAVKKAVVFAEMSEKPNVDELHNDILCEYV